jgi:hypothetical protein
MERDGFMRYLTCINRYMIVYESIVTIGINGQVESKRKSVKGTTEAISLEEGMVIHVNLTSHEDLKLGNFEWFLYMSVNYKRNHQWKKKTKREERKHPTLIYTTSCRKVKKEKLSQKEIRSMKIGGAHEFRERLFR